MTVVKLKIRDFKSGKAPVWSSYSVSEGMSQLAHATNIHNAGVACLRSLYEVFSKLYAQKKSGGTTNQQQDVLRSMLVFAGATLDGTLKQVIRGALPELAVTGSQTLQKLQAFIKKQLQATRGVVSVDTDLMARAFIEDNPKEFFLTSYADHLTKGSLQSADALIMAHDALGFDLGISTKGLKAALEEAFKHRNRVIHELDYNENRSSKRQRLRNQCSKPEILSHVDLLLQTSKAFIDTAQQMLA